MRPCSAAASVQDAQPPEAVAQDVVALVLERREAHAMPATARFTPFWVKLMK